MDTSTNGENKLAKPPISVTIKDKHVLHAAYMVFLKSGGLFIPINKPFEIDQEVSLLVNLAISEPVLKFAVNGKVVWITPQQSQGSRAGGIGVEFYGKEGLELKHAIEKILAESLKSEEPTHTM
jgi:type IV pilus assembly protein PilZ